MSSEAMRAYYSRTRLPEQGEIIHRPLLSVRIEDHMRRCPQIVDLRLRTCGITWPCPLLDDADGVHTAEEISSCCWYIATG